MDIQKIKDNQLLRYLRSNSRLTLTQISRKTRIPISTLHDRLKKYEKEIVLKHTTLVDFAKLGYHTKLHMLLRIPQQVKQQVAARLQVEPHINTVSTLANNYDLFAEGVFDTIATAQEFISRLEQDFTGLECDTHFVVQDLKREEFLSLEGM